MAYRFLFPFGEVEQCSTVYAEDGAVNISDYKYTPKHRGSLSESRIGVLLNEWYEQNNYDVLSLIRKFCSYKQSYEKIPAQPLNNGPYWTNGYVPPFDAISIYGFLAIRNPRYYVEVGSGNTTLFAAQSIRDNGLRTKIISIDPFPRTDIDKLCHELYRLPFEDMAPSFFETLSSEDILLIDNSHRAFPNSDVTVFFTEVLPKLPAGLLYTMHDIFLPFDYPEEFNRWYNEQYLLCAYILGGADGDKIICPNCFLGSKNDIFEVCSSLWGESGLFQDSRPGGGFFWLEKA